MHIFLPLLYIVILIMLQYERAAEIYRKMKRPMASSRCYELLGQFNRALIVLYENEYFDMAIDTLKRYRMLMEVCCRKKPDMVGILL